MTQLRAEDCTTNNVSCTVLYLFIVCIYPVNARIGTITTWYKWNWADIQTWDSRKRFKLTFSFIYFINLELNGN